MSLPELARLAEAVQGMSRFVVLEAKAKDLAAHVARAGQLACVVASVDAALAELGGADVAGLVLSPQLDAADRRRLIEHLASLGTSAPALVIVGLAHAPELTDGLCTWCVPGGGDASLLAAVLAACRERFLRLRAEASNCAKSDFLASISHEIRTPLGAMLGFVELLKDPRITPGDHRAYIETIDRNGRELVHLLDDILDISKVEAGCFEVEQMPFELPRLLEDVILSLGVRASAKGIALTITSEGPLPSLVCSDPTRLRQILVNVIGNAIKFTGGGNVEVRVKTLPGERLVFVVKDTGVGIPEAARSKLFQPFTQVGSSTTRIFGGTGLGLALSRKLAQLLGGDVVLESSEVGVGSTFVVTITQGKVDTQGDRSTSALEDELAAPRCEIERPLSGLRVLVAEDAPDSRYLIERLLVGSGAGVVLVENGAVAVERAMADHFDVILMDIQMPVVDGYEATRALRRRGYARPIIALTAHAMREERERCLAAGCDDHLTKPLAAGLLLEAITRHARPLGPAASVPPC
jgi:signal transduction histidine kinase/ActR/RegA family two-component response regulator